MSESPPKAQLLLIEDEATIAEFVATELRFEGYLVQVERDGMRGLMAARNHPPDLVLLDRQLPELDGLEVCRRLRATSDVPIILLTAMGETRDKVEGLNAGANDYLAKPFDVEELLARINAQLRARKPAARTRFALADLSLDTTSREVLRGDRAIALTPKEFDLLAYLLRHPRQVMTREQIVAAVWGTDFVGDDNVLEVYVRYVRNKIEEADKPKLLHTVRGVGYVLREPASA